eukprot:scaffold83209_cov67-Phaeocystis_antarctica.AAC.5
MAISEVSIITSWVAETSKGIGAFLSLFFMCQTLLLPVISYSKSRKYSKYSFDQTVGVSVHGPSKPEVVASFPLPVLHGARPWVGGVHVGRHAAAVGADAMALAEGVATADERDRLRVVHAHAPEA